MMMAQFVVSSTGVHGGTLDVRSGGTAVVDGGVNKAVTVAGTLRGSGTITGTVTVNGTFGPGGVAAGATLGTMTINNTVTLNAGSTSRFELYSSVVGYDRLVVTGASGNIVFGGTLQVVPADDGFGYGFNNTFDLFDWSGTASGTFGSITLPPLLPGFAWHDFGGGVKFDYATGQIKVVAAATSPATRTWSGGSDPGTGDGNWSTAANWGTSGIPANNDPKDLLVFSGSARPTNNNNIAGLAVGGLSFAADAGAFVLGGQSVQVAGKIVDQSAADPQKIDLGVEFLPGADSGTIEVVESGSLEMAKPVIGTVGLKKTGAGTATLSAANTYGAGTSVEAGRLKLTGSILSTTGLTVAGPAILELAGSAGSATAANAAIGNAGTLVVSTPAQQAGAISGTGVTSVEAAASLTADSIIQNTLTIGAGGSVTIRETAGGAANANAVPEPSVFVLLGIGALGLLSYALRRTTK